MKHARVAAVSAALTLTVSASLIFSACIRDGFDPGPPELAWDARPRATCAGGQVTFSYLVLPGSKTKVTGLRIDPDVGVLDLSETAVTHIPDRTKTYDVRAQEPSGTWFNPWSVDPIEVRVLRDGDLEEISIAGTSKLKNNEPPCEWVTTLTKQAYGEKVWVRALSNPMPFGVRVVHEDPAGVGDLDVTLPAATPAPVDLAAAVPILGQWTFEPTDAAALNQAIAASKAKSCIGFPVRVAGTVVCR